MSEHREFLITKSKRSEGIQPMNREEVERIRATAARMERIGRRMRAMDERYMSPQARERVRLEVLEVVAVLAAIGFGSFAAGIHHLISFGAGWLLNPVGILFFYFAIKCQEEVAENFHTLVRGKKVG